MSSQIPRYCEEEMEWNGGELSFATNPLDSDSDEIGDAEFCLIHLRSVFPWFDRLCYKLESLPHFSCISLGDPDELNGVYCPMLVIEEHLRELEQIRLKRDQTT